MPNHRILIVAENVSARFGGEAFLPLHYFRVLRSRGIEVFLLTHERVKSELEELFPHDIDRIEFVPDTRLNVVLWQMGRRVTKSIEEVSVGALRLAIFQKEMRKRARRIVREQSITVVHEPIPVSPKRPSGMFDLGAPVVIGPMNGNMNFPPAFSDFRGTAAEAAIAFGRGAAEVANRLAPGKVKASVLLVSNPRTRAGLARCTSGVPVVELVENGVDLARFKRIERTPSPKEKVRFVFLGRLVDWKAVDLLLEAVAAMPSTASFVLEIIGDGEERPALEQLVGSLGIKEQVQFLGFMPQAEVAERLEDVEALVLPSLYECGGAVVLEAMAKSLPVIATNWGGPADYLDESCGILIETTDRKTIIDGFRDAMVQLCESAALRHRLGEAGRKKVELQYDWERKVDRILEIYEQVSR